MADILTETPLTVQSSVQPIAPAVPDWQYELKTAIASVQELLAAVDLPVTALPERMQAQSQFALRVPRAFIERMRKGDANDPLLLQVLPQPEELQLSPGYSLDPLAEQDAAVPGLLHKYRSRVLLITTGACAINCRYCFRRHFPYDDNRPGRKGLQTILDYIAAHPEVNEVILSGGDPLAAPDSYLHELVQRLAELPQLTRLRVHTRLPIVIPNRVTPALVQALTGTRLRAIMVLHANHAQELDASVDAAVQRLRAAGVTLLNQSVLLHGINANVPALVDLSERLFACGVLPYYLHVLDKVQGASHFAVSDEDAKALVRELLVALPGFLVPKLTREVAGAFSKVPLDLGV